MSEANATGPNPTINLAAHIADEYGVPAVTALEIVRRSRIMIEGEDYFGDPERVPLEDLEGKAVIVNDPHAVRGFAFTYRQPFSQRFG